MLGREAKWSSVLPGKPNQMCEYKADGQLYCYDIGRNSEAKARSQRQTVPVVPSRTPVKPLTSQVAPRSNSTPGRIDLEEKYTPETFCEACTQGPAMF